MPYLNWTDSPVDVSVTPHSRLGTELTLALSAELTGQLREPLRNVLLEGRGELRVDLPKGWTLYWKARTSESRMLLAHPEPTAWVGTVALAPAQSERLMEALSLLVSESQPEALCLSALGPLTGMSNFELRIRLVS